MKGDAVKLWLTPEEFLRCVCARARPDRRQLLDRSEAEIRLLESVANPVRVASSIARQCIVHKQMIIIDPKGTILFTNSATRETFQYGKKVLES